MTAPNSYLVGGVAEFRISRIGRHRCPPVLVVRALAVRAVIVDVIELVCVARPAGPEIPGPDERRPLR